MPQAAQGRWGGLTPPRGTPGFLYNPPQLQRLRTLTDGFINASTTCLVGLFFCPVSATVPQFPSYVRLGWGWGAVLLYLARFRTRLGRNVTNA